MSEVDAFAFAFAPAEPALASFTNPSHPTACPILASTLLAVLELELSPSAEGGFCA
jgi:hypothetical protein